MEFRFFYFRDFGVLKDERFEFFFFRVVLEIVYVKFGFYLYGGRILFLKEIVSRNF